MIFGIKRMGRISPVLVFAMLVVVFGLVLACTAPSARALTSSSIDISAPASAEAQTSVTISAQVSEPTRGLSYKFVYANADWSDWDVIQPLSSSNSCTWVPGSEGPFTIFVDVVDTSGTCVTNSYHIDVTPQNYTLGSLSVPAEGNVGSAVPLDITVSGNTTDLQYKYVYEKDAWATWGVVDGTPSESSAASWTPAEQGEYTIFCNVIDSSGNVSTLTDTVSVGASFTAGSLSVQTSNPSVGETVRLASTIASGGASGLQYKFVYQKDAWATWGVVNNGPSASSAVDWMPESPGLYTIYCDIIDSFGNVQTLVSTVNVSVEHYTFRSIRASAYTGQTGGAPITFTADTSGEDQYLRYKFVVEKDGWSTWYVAQEPSSSNTLVWTPTGAGNWTVHCDVIDSGGNVTTHAVSGINIAVESYSVGSLTATGSSLQKLGEGITLTVDTSGVNQYLSYKMVWQKDNWASWGEGGIVSSNTFAFSPGAPGNYNVIIDVIDTAGNYQTLSYAVTYWNYQGVNLGFSGNNFVITPNLGAQVDGFTYKYVVSKNGWQEWSVLNGDFTGDTSWTYPFNPNDRSTYDFFVDVRDPDGNYVGSCSTSFAITGTYYDVSLSDLATMEYYVDISQNYGYSDWWGYYNAANPANYSPGSGAYYQFARIDGATHFCTAGQINDFIASTSTGRRGNLQGMGIVFIAAAQANNINADYLVCHALLESAWGTSTLAGGYYYGGGLIDGNWYGAGTYYNFYGIGAYDSSPLSGGRKSAILEGWNSRDAAIYGAASWISRNYVNSYRHQNTLYLMKWDLYNAEYNGYVSHQYATSLTWPVSIANLMGSMFSREGVTPYYAYDVPCFRY